MSVPESRSAEMLRKLVVDGGKSRFGRRPRLAVLGAATVLISLALFGVFGGDGAGDVPRYRTVAAHTGDLVINVSANGNLQPTNSVDVGSELSGIVESVHVDVNDRVRKGQAIARLQGEGPAALPALAPNLAPVQGVTSADIEQALQVLLDAADA